MLIERTFVYAPPDESSVVGIVGVIAFALGLLTIWRVAAREEGRR